MALKIACVGGGPGGLLFSTLIKAAHPEAEVTVFERNRADDTFGFGVVFSDATLARIHAADPVLRDALDRHGEHWDRIEVRLKDERWDCGGNGMTAIRRKTLLALLQDRAGGAGVDLRFETEVTYSDVAHYDLVVASDGANSRIRDQFTEVFEPTSETAAAKFIWFGTTYAFRGLTFVHERSADGVFAVHGYPIGEGLSTFIVETDEATWRRAGLDGFDPARPPGDSDLKSKEYLEKLFAEQIDGHPLVTNNSRWANFRTRRASKWHHGNLVLLGDAAHTAHFSVGSGTKMAMEDAIALARALDENPSDPLAAAVSYEALARPSVDRIQSSARPSLSWWEHFGQYHDALEPWQFSFHFLSRSIDVARLEQRAPEYIAEIRAAWHQRHGAAPLHTPLQVADVTFPGRQVALVPNGGGASVVTATGDAIPLMQAGTTGGRWGLWITAPDDDAAVDSALADTLSILGDAALVAMSGGSRLTRTLLAERLRQDHAVPTLILEPTLDEAIAETLVLSGRADLVGTWTGGA